MDVDGTALVVEREDSACLGQSIVAWEGTPIGVMAKWLAPLDKIGDQEADKCMHDASYQETLCGWYQILYDDPTTFQCNFSCED